MISKTILISSKKRIDIDNIRKMVLFILFLTIAMLTVGYGLFIFLSIRKLQLNQT